MIVSRLSQNRVQNWGPDDFAEPLPAEYWGWLCEDLGTHEFFDQAKTEGFNLGGQDPAVLGRSYHRMVVGVHHNGNENWGWLDYDDYQDEVLKILAKATNQRKHLAFGVIDEVPILPGFR